MAEYKVPKGTDVRNSFPLNHYHVMSHNFGVLNVVSMMLMAPGDEFDINLKSFTRLLPLPTPTFGGVRLIKRAFFVPFEFCYRGFSDFLAGEKVVLPNGTMSALQIPFVTVEDIYDAFISDSSICFVSGTDHKQDFVAAGGVGYTYTSKGRKLRSFLYTIGIKLPFICYTMDVSKPNRSSYAETRFDLLKLLAFWKFYLDWVVPARFVMTNPKFVKIKQYLDNYISNPAFTATTIKELLDVPVSFLEDDYYTSAFVTPYGPETLPSTSTTGLDVVSSGTSASSAKNPLAPLNNLDGEPYVISGNNNTVLTQLQLLSLGRLQDMVNKRKITDSHVLDWLKVTYGVAPSKDALRYSSYLGSSSNVIQIGDVMSTANTEIDGFKTYVGQYAGKGIGFDENHWKYTTDKHGVLFVTCELQAKTSYVNGLSPLSQMFDPKDFFDPLFDNVGVRAVTKRELSWDTFDSEPNFAALDLPDNQVPNADSPFGFVPRYSEYKYMNDMVSGDFICPSVNAGMDSWYLTRQFGFLDNPKISLDFCSAASDTVGSVYDRIFQNTNNDDHFYTYFSIMVNASRNMEKTVDYFETINSEQGKKTISMSNNNVIG